MHECMNALLFGSAERWDEIHSHDIHIYYTVYHAHDTLCFGCLMSPGLVTPWGSHSISKFALLRCTASLNHIDMLHTIFEGCLKNVLKRTLRIIYRSPTTYKYKRLFCGVIFSWCCCHASDSFYDWSIFFEICSVSVSLLSKVSHHQVDRCGRFHFSLLKFPHNKINKCKPFFFVLFFDQRIFL